MGEVHCDTIARILRHFQNSEDDRWKLYTAFNIRGSILLELESNYASHENPLLLFRNILQTWIMKQGNKVTVKNLIQLLQKQNCMAIARLSNIYKLTDFVVNEYTIRANPIVSEIFSYKGQSRHTINLSPLLNLLSQVGDGRVVIISLHGRASERKAYVATKLTAYLQRKASNHAQQRGTNTILNSTIISQGASVLNQIHYLQTNLGKVGIIIIFANDALDEPLPNRVKESITCFPMLLSTISIFVDFYGQDRYSWAENFLPAFRKYISCGSGKLHQKLIVLPIEDEAVTHNSKGSRTFFKNVNNYFGEVLTFPAGIDPIVYQENRHVTSIDEKVKEKLINHFERFLNWGNWTKQILGNHVTAKQLKDFVIKWADIVSTSTASYVADDFILRNTIGVLTVVKIEELVEEYRIAIVEYVQTGAHNFQPCSFETFHGETLMNKCEKLEKILQNCKEPEGNTSNQLILLSERINNIKKYIVGKQTQRSRKHLPTTSQSFRVNTREANGSCKLSYDKNARLGKGSNETVVYRGKFGERIVAVKRLNCVHYDIKKAQNEVSALINFDRHENVIRYFDQEMHGDEYILIAVELCDMSLQMWISDKKRRQHANILPTQILWQCTQGVEYLHEHNIIHRDIKPENILLVVDQMTQKVTTKISDFGLCKQLPFGENSLTQTSQSGSYGWQAPEVLQYLEDQQNGQAVPKISCKTDIFSLGCVYYYVLTDGQHLFGSIVSRQHNILKGRPKITDEWFDKKFYIGSKYLISAMISPTKEGRPSACAILKNPLFWSNVKTMDFLTDINQCLQQPGYNFQKDSKQWLESKKRLVFNNENEWGAQLSPPLRKYLASQENAKPNTNKYNFMLVSELIRLIRNLHMHSTKEKPKDMNNFLGLGTMKYIENWTSTFPFLIPITWLAFQKIKVKENSCLARFYPKDFDFDLEIVKQPNKTLTSNGRNLMPQRHNCEDH